MKLEKAVFGQVGQGHGLRGCTSSRDFFMRSSQWFDLPDSLPSGVQLSPYISGFSLGNKYVLARTFPDFDASRSGMVISYVLSFSIEEIDCIKNLEQLLNLLPRHPCEMDTFFDQGIDVTVVSDLTEGKRILANDIAKLIVDRRSGPVIHVGITEFEPLVISIWEKLWPNMRRNFSFRLSLGPQDCVEPVSPNLVCIPESLIARWGDNHKIIGKTQSNDSYSKVASVFLDDGKQYMDFASEFGIVLNRPTQLELLVQAYTKSLLMTQEFSNCLSLVRFIESLSPEVGKGQNAKIELVCRLESFISDVHVEEILKFRNLVGSAFSSFQIVWNAIKLKIRTCGFSSQDDDFLIQILRDSIENNQVEEAWRSAVQSGFEEALTDGKSQLHSAIWRWLDREPEKIIPSLTDLNIDPFVEDLLVVHAPNNISEKNSNSLLSFFEKNNFLQLHGLVLGLCCSTNDAFSKQLKIDRNELFTKGLEALIQRVNPDELLGACLQFKDQRIANITVRKAIKCPSILFGVSFSSKESLSIWCDVLSIVPDSWNAPHKSQDILFLLLDEYLNSGNSRCNEIIRLLSKTPLADLCEFSQRSKIWRLLNCLGCDGDYLFKTANGWYRRALEMKFVDLDSDLEKAIYSIPELKEKMNLDSLKNTKGILGIFTHVNLFSESDFVEWLKFWIDTEKIKSELDMREIGKVITDKHWVKAARLVLDKYNSSSSDIRIILESCKGILPIWDLFKIGSYGGYTDKKWEALVETVKELYPSGPDDQEIWSRAGGESFYVSRYGSGLERWERAVRHVRYGGSPTPEKLIQVMKQDFNNSDKVCILEKIFEE